MDVKWLEDFVCLARSGSFSRAAEERNVTQSAFSRRIRALELWLGTRLIDRSTYPTHLTLQGLDFLAVANDVLAALYEARATLREGAARTGRTVLISAPHTLAVTFFPGWLSGFESTTGPLDVRMMADNLHNCAKAMAEGVCDLMLCFAHPETPILVDTTAFEYGLVGTECLIPVSVPDTDGNARHALPGSKAAPVPYLAYGGESFLGRVVDLILRRVPEPPHLLPSYENSFAEALKAMVLQGRGIAWLPASCVAEALKEGRLVRAGGTAWGEPLEVRLYRARGENRPLVAEIWEKAVHSSATYLA